ncbi:MAG: helix-turn-helix domain-containing protein [Clostridiales bacterium]|nr:helix-turn-helix domain-containing protein [Clostridiales bacterium]
MTLGTKLQGLRKKKNFSQEELAAQLNVSRQSVSKWELDESLPDIENIVKLSSVFNVTTDFLCKDEIDNDNDLPVIKVAEENAKTAYRSKVLSVLSVCLLSIGFLGIAASWLLSRFIVAFRWTADGPPAVEPYDSNQSLVYPRIEVKGDYWAFLNTYHLEMLFIICVILIVAGVVLLIVRKKQK